MAVEINIPKPVIDYNDLDNKPNLVTAHSELNLDDGTNPHGTTASDVGAYTTTETDNLLNNKVDKVTGERLITATEITKLLGIQDGAEVNVNADWNATSGDALILNKPTIPNPANFVAKADYTPAHSVLVQQSGTGSPTSVQIGNNEFLGRKTGGGANIQGLSVSEAQAMLGVGAWIDYSSLSTIVGWSSFTTTNIFYKYLSNDLIMVIFSISGTSNSTALTFTIPNTVLTGIGNINLGHFSCINNGVYRWVDFTGNGGSNVITATPTSTNIPTPGTWATSGTKSVNGTLLIPIQ